MHLNTVEQSEFITEDQYVGAVLGAVAWFLVFYVAAARVNIIYHVSKDYLFSLFIWH